MKTRRNSCRGRAAGSPITRCLIRFGFRFRSEFSFTIGNVRNRQPTRNDRSGKRNS
jgi:hypothetical protein